MTMQPKTQKISVKKLKPNPDNPRIVKDDKFAKLVKSIKDFPQMMDLRPIVVDSDMVILGGNMRYKACVDAGMKDVPVVVASDLTEEQKREFIIKDNLGYGEWDWDSLRADWDVNQLNDWGLEVDVSVLQSDDDLSAMDEYQIETTNTDICVGDVFDIGRHRLICGDSTDSDVWITLMNGKRWQCLVTSPPYNQGGCEGDLFASPGSKAKFYNDKNSDNKSPDEYKQFIIDVLNNSSMCVDLSHTVAWNVAYNAKSRNDYGVILFGEQNPYKVKETIIWDKGHSINLPQVGIYSRRCEFVFVMSCGDKYRTTQTYNDCRWNYWQISSSKSQMTGGTIEHRAAYPSALVQQILNDFSYEDDIIVDPFCGTGTTMMVSNSMKRKCYGIEIDPLYCNTILNRMAREYPDETIFRNGKPYHIQS